MLFFLRKIIPASIFRFFQPAYHYALAFLAALFFGFPSRRLIVIGVTGTDGKSTTVHLLHELFSQSGIPVASVSSFRFKIKNEEAPNLLKMTMPGRFFIQRFLRRAVRAGAKVAVLEVTSEGIRQFRHAFIAFDGAVWTNLTPEHIESHGGFEKYRAAKSALFRALRPEGVAVLNRDDEHCDYFARSTRAKKVFYGARGIVAEDGREYSLSSPSFHERVSFVLDGVVFRSPLVGTFNAANVLAAAATAHAFGVPFKKIAEALEHIPPPPGRLEVIQEKPFRVVVDYAHTPNALRKTYETLCDIQSITYGGQPRLICVLGAAGGGRDKWKRPEFGKIAGEFCGEIILTNEDPYDESPSDIIEDIEKGFSPNSKFQIPNSKKILDRREAIREALRLAKPGDTVVITGKGAEQWIMGPAGVKIPWDDRIVVKDELSKIPPASH